MAYWLVEHTLLLTYGTVFQFTVRYLDFGNSEERDARHLAPLRSEFKQLLFQAVQCSIVCEEHTSFTQPVSNRVFITPYFIWYKIDNYA